MSQKLHDRFGINDHEVPKDKREILIENRDQVLAELGTLYLKQQIHQMVMESQASEHSARMVAMKTATDNAGNLLNDLTLQYNRARQAAITQKFGNLSSHPFKLKNLFDIMEQDNSEYNPRKNHSSHRCRRRRRVSRRRNAENLRCPRGHIQTG